MANELQFFLDAPVAFGTGTGAAAYDAVGGSDLGSTATNGTVIYKRLSGICGITIKGMGFIVVTSVTGGTAVVLTCYVRPTVGTDAARRTVGTITVPATAVTGDVCWGTWGDDDISVNPGEEIIVEVTTKATTACVGYITATFNPFFVGATSGGSATAPKVTVKPYGVAKVGQIKLVSSGTTGN
jgi:hypothetical protein